MYLRGSTQCKFQVQVYVSSTTPGVFILEANRLTGDANSFRIVYGELKGRMDLSMDTMSSKPQDSFAGTIFPMATGTPKLLDDAETQAALLPIVNMAKSPMLESQTIAAEILCDLSSLEGIQQQLCDAGCVQVLVALTSSQLFAARQYAFLALGNLSQNADAQDTMIECGIINAILPLFTDGPYDDAELRREGARIFANCSAWHGSRVVSALGAQSFTSWKEGINILEDERIRLHAERALDSLNTHHGNHEEMTLA